MRTLDEKLEPHLIPLITGNRSRITPEQQSDIATWAAMKAIVAEYEDPDQVSVHHAHRKMLFKKQRLPLEGWAVWLGYFPRAPWRPMYRCTPFHYVPKEKFDKLSDTRITHYNGSITTQVIGELLVHVVHAPKKFSIATWSYPTFPNGGSLRRVWPPNNYSIAWPPRPFSEQDAFILCQTLRDHIARGTKKRLGIL